MINNFFNIISYILLSFLDYAASKSWSFLEQIFHQQKTNFSERIIWWAICILFIQLFLWFVDYDKITLFISCLLIQNAIYYKKKKNFFISVLNSRKCCNQSLQNGPTCFVMCHTFVLLAQMYLIFIFMLSLKFLSGTSLL